MEIRFASQQISRLIFYRFTAVCRQRPTRKPCCGRETAWCLTV